MIHEVNCGMKFKKAAVIGAGTMGHGICQVLATAGIEAGLIDVSDEILGKALEQIRSSLERFVKRGSMKPEEEEAILSRIRVTTKTEEAVRDADLVVEAVPERLELKKQIFNVLDKAAPKNCILATNTSSLPITEVAKATSRPEKVIGMHFFNPPALMRLIEIVRGEKTSNETTDNIVELSKTLGKTPIVVRKDVPGFIVNRVLVSALNECYWTVYRGEAKMLEVDSALKYAGKFPMGAFELSDYIGLDVLNEITKVMAKAYGDVINPCPTLGALVSQQKLGRKTGSGFYDWSSGRPEIPSDLADKFDMNRFYIPAINEACRLIHEDVADARDIDTAIKLGMNWPYGPCEFGDTLGLDIVLNSLKKSRSRYGDERYKASPLLEEYVSKGWLGKKTGRGFYKYE